MLLKYLDIISLHKWRLKYMIKVLEDLSLFIHFQDILHLPKHIHILPFFH
ncbi:hypothetical protein HanPSC8_Chr01g0006861 [Helianthus annuus]|nr:hypothetical protein HanPSC8_Chr01g0006861 [Helianthus annuus]